MAATVLSIALVAIFQALGASVRGTERVEEEIVATSVASDLLDFLCTIPCSEWPPAGDRRKRLTATDLTTLAAAFDRSDPLVARVVRAKLESVRVGQSCAVSVTAESVEPEPTAAAARVQLLRITVSVGFGGPARAAGRAARAVTLGRIVTDDAEVGS